MGRMNKIEFLESPCVKEFIKWLGLKLDNPKSFTHSYRMKRGNKAWSCDSIYSSYERYEWPFKCTNPVTGRRLIGKTFEENQSTLCGLSNGLRQGVLEKDSEKTRQYCLSILEWGGVLPKNQGKILKLGHDLPIYLDNVRHRLDPTDFDTNHNCADILMNSGFTKIYSLLINDFIIYDGRVGAALGLLVRKYCEENNLPIVPQKLLFAYGNAQRITLEGIGC